MLSLRSKSIYFYLRFYDFFKLKTNFLKTIYKNEKIVFFGIYIRMLKVTISEFRSIAKGRNIGGYKNMMMMMNCFCGMVDRRKAFSLISSRDHCQRSSPTRISDTS